MGDISNELSNALDAAYRLPHVTGDKLVKTDLKDAADIILNGTEGWIFPIDTAVAVSASISLDLSRDRDLGEVSLVQPTTISINQLTKRSMVGASMSLIPNNHSVALSNIHNVGDSPIDITAKNEIVFATVAGTDFFRVLKKTSITGTQIQAPVVSSYALNETTLRFYWADDAYNNDTIIETSLDGISFNPPVSLGASAVNYDITGLTIGAIRYVRVKFIGDGILYTDSDYSSVTSGIVTIVYMSMIFDNNINNYLSADPVSSVNFGNGTTLDAPQSHAARFKLTTLTALSPILSRGDVTFGYAVYVNTNGSLTVAYYDDNTSNIIYASSVAGVVTTGVWYHIADTYNGLSINTGIDLYLNGVKLTLTRASVGTYAAYPHINTKLRIGSFKQGGTLFKSGALISDYAIISKKMTDAEALELYNLNANPVSTLTFIADVALFNRLNGDLINEVGDLNLTITGVLNYSTDGAY